MANSQQLGPAGRNPFEPAPYTPSSLGKNDCGDPSCSVIGDSPGAVGDNDAAAMCIEPTQPLPPQTINVCLLDPYQLEVFFFAAAYARIMQKSLKREYKEIEHDVALYKYLLLGTSGAPGEEQISIGDAEEIRRQANDQATKDEGTFLRMCDKGPQAAIDFLWNTAGIWVTLDNDIQEAFAENRELNQSIRKMTAGCIEKLARIKEWSTIVLSEVAAITGNAKVVLISFGYDVVVKIIETLDSEEARGADAIAVVGWDEGTKAAREAAKLEAEAWQKEAILRAQTLAQKAEQLNGKLKIHQFLLDKASDPPPTFQNRIRVGKSVLKDLAKNKSTLRDVSGNVIKNEMKAAAWRLARLVLFIFDARQASSQYQKDVAAGSE
jgi:hypothetical protein